MKHTLIRILIIFLFLSVLSACAMGIEQQEGNRQQGYKEIKSIVIDILKTEEAQQAIKEAEEKNTDEEKLLLMLSSPEGQQIQLAVKSILTDPNYSKALEDLMTDPKFAGEFAKAVQEENKDIHKELMKDPEYQALVMDIMKSSDFEELLIENLKSKEFRKHTMTILQESLENPIFQIKMIELMKKAIEEQSKEEQGNKEKSKSDEKES